jgi:hypothetical protein
MNIQQQNWWSTHTAEYRWLRHRMGYLESSLRCTCAQCKHDSAQTIARYRAWRRTSRAFQEFVYARQGPSWIFRESAIQSDRLADEVRDILTRVWGREENEA